MIPCEPVTNIVIPVWVSSHASLTSLLSFMFLMVATINVNKADWFSFLLPLVAGGSVLIAGYPVFSEYGYAIVGWLLIAGLLSAFRTYIYISTLREAGHDAR